MSNLAEQKGQKRYTYADYVKWDDKTIDGIAYAMAGPSRVHQKIIKAFKETGVSDEQIENAVKKLNDSY